MNIATSDVGNLQRLTLGEVREIWSGGLSAF